MDSLEHTLVFHCAPALAGIKPSSLVCCHRQHYPGLEGRLDALERQLAGSGIRLRPVRRWEGRVLVLAYRRQALEAHLAKAEVQAFLHRAGYPAGDAEQVLRHLEKRLAGSPTFPHEVGILLGYPPEDVEGFCRHRGRNCKLCGPWKVYGDPDRARELFGQYTRCRDTCCSLLGRGVGIGQLFGAA